MSEPTTDSRLALAKARAATARARLSGTISELQARTRPAALVHDAADTLKERGSDMVLGLIDTAKRKPAQASAAVALAGLFLARHQIARLFRRAPPAPPKSSKIRDRG